MKIFLIIGIVFCGLSVVLGAFGAHGLKSHLNEYAMALFQTGVQYQMSHGLALIGLVLFCGKSPSTKPLFIAGIAFVLGVLIFSGSLYAIALTGIKKLGMITPIGGLSFIVAWISFLYGVIRTDFS
ncbi:MAG: DUF423 domain-containing protein [Candidatus Cloacimonetes bacterium]|nr:DUF423 domain-containing protein [Candidatus Cloacimonadota bacterium]